MEGNFECPVCGNTDARYIGYFKDAPYCRLCISFRGREVKEEEFTLSKHQVLLLNYELTDAQKKISKEILENFLNNKDQLIYAVCGAGKTELVFELMDYCVKNGLRVGFAIPRRDVVMELSYRLQKAFPKSIVIAVYGGNTDLINGDIIVLTTHQLYRYKEFFDMLIVDELDAFPYKGNKLLESMFKRSIKCRYVLMSATPNDELIKEFEEDENKVVLRHMTRYHKHPIPVPVIKRIPGKLKMLYVIKKIKEYKKLSKPLLIFVPTIALSKELYYLTKDFAKSGYFVNSQSEKRKEIIQDFRDGKYSHLFTTAVLERGVTLPNLQVIIYDADNRIYNRQALIQISGRVGRVKTAPDGEVIFLCDKKTKDMVKAIDKTIEANSYL